MGGWWVGGCDCVWLSFWRGGGGGGGVGGLGKKHIRAVVYVSVGEVLFNKCNPGIPFALFLV